MTDMERSNVLDAIYVLNDLFDGLIAGTMVFNHYQGRFEQGQFSKEGIVSVQKMCVSHLVLSLCKLCEFWVVFHHVVPEEFRPEVKKLVSRLNKLDVKEYRNSVVAHIKDRKLGRAKTQFESMDVLYRISGSDPKGFLIWLNDPNQNDYPKTVVSIVQSLRDHLREKYQITADEVFAR